MPASPRAPEARALLQGVALEDPHPVFARLRAHAPLSSVADTGVHVVSSWALIEEALQREDDFSSNLTGVLMRGDDGQPAVFDFPGGPSGATDVIATADEPAHAVHRRLIQPRLAPARIAALEPRLRGWTRRLLAPWLAAGGGDFVPIAEAIPALALAHLLGLPEADAPTFRAWAMMGGDMLAGDVTQTRLLELAQATGRMAEYLRHHFDAAMAAPAAGPDAPLLHALARGVAEGAIDEPAAIGIAIVLFGAAGESTAALLGSTVRLLSERADLAEALAARPELIGRFVEEVVRLEPPFKFHYRSVQRDCALGGVALRRGDRLMLAWAAANRDPAVFEAPDELRLDRRHPRAHMGFGRGRHFCVGATLARLEARLVVEELLAEPRRLVPAPGAGPAYAPSIFVRRLERLPIRVEGAAVASG